LEDELVGLNGDGGWGLSNGGLKLVNGVGLNVGVVLNVDLTLIFGGIAGSISSSVGIVLLEVLGVGLGIGEGGILPSSIATV